MAAATDQRAFGVVRTSSGPRTGAVELATGQFRDLHPVGRDGLGFAVAEGPWYVWSQLRSAGDPYTWSLHAIDTRTWTHRMLADSIVNGYSPRGLLARPVVRDGQVAWAQPISDTDQTAELHVMDLATSRHAVVARGILSDAAYAGPWLVWATETTAGSSSLQAVDARTLKPATVPLPTLDGTPRHLTGSHDYLLWTDLDQRHVTAWDLPSGKVTRFTTEDAKIPFQFFELVGHYALWYDGEYQDLMDLRTGGWVRLPGGTATVMPSGLVVASYPQAGSTTATTGGTRYSVVRTDQIPPLPCA